MRRRRAARHAAAWAVVLAAASSWARLAIAQPSQASGPGGSDPALATRGKQIYTRNCARCHGLNMASPGAGFFDLRTFPAGEKSRFFDSVMNGKRVMPAWKESLSGSDIEALWSYVMTAKR